MAAVALRAQARRRLHQCRYVRALAAKGQICHKALMETGYKGFVGQEFVPAQEDKIASLEKCIRICDV